MPDFGVTGLGLERLLECFTRCRVVPQFPKGQSTECQQEGGCIVLVLNASRQVHHVDKVRWSRAASRAGQTLGVSGPVKSVRYEPDEKGSPTFINIGADYPSPKRFTAIVWGKDRDNFYDLDQFDGQHVCVYGTVRTYQGIAQIYVQNPSQMKGF